MRALIVVGVAAGVLCLDVRPADAGDCSNGGADVVKALEAHARKPQTPAPEVWGLCVEQDIAYDKKLTKRFLAACEAILARDATYGDCLRWSIELGAKQLGKVDLFDAITATTKIEPFVYGNGVTHLYVKLDDPRAAPLVRAAWQSALTDKRAAPSAHRNTQHNYTVFRHAAIKLLGKHGTADDATFLAEQAKATTDKGLKKAIAKAVAAIEKRAAPPPKMPAAP